jgi:hypothetical protein
MGGPVLDDDPIKRVEKLRSLLGVAESQPTTEQTAYDLEAIRDALKQAKAELEGRVRNGDGG